MGGTSRLIALLSLSLLAACEDRTPLDRQADPMAPAPPAPPPSSSGGPFVSDAGTPAAADAATGLVTIPSEKQTDAREAGVVTGPPAPAATSCAELAAGGTSDELNGFVWQVVVTTGESSAAWDYVSLGYACGLKYQHANEVAVVTMNADDCAASHAWATNARFLEVLRTGDGCPSGDGRSTTEAFDVSIANREPLGRKTSRCPEPTLDVERGCFRALVDRLFPR